MGYEVHIIRQNNWENNAEDSTITIEEWLDYASSDNELKLTNGVQTKIANVDISWKESPGFCEWVAYPLADGSHLPWFDYRKGSISSKNPDYYVLKKMFAIASHFNAKLLDDDGEFVDESALELMASESTETIKKDLSAHKKPWWKFW